MNYKVPLSLFLATALPGLGSIKPLNPHLVIEEKDGVVAVEAEHFVKQTNTDKRAWHITSVKKTPEISPDGDPSHAKTASGGAYLEILPDTRRTHDDRLIKGTNFTEVRGSIGVLTYRIKFNTPGRYYCWVRTYSTGTEDNGIHLGLNDTWPKSASRMQWTKRNEWTWDSKQRTEEVHTGVFGKIWIDIPFPGIHEIKFSMREDGFEFDKFILTQETPDASKPPKNKGPRSKVFKSELPKPFWKKKPAKQKESSAQKPKFPKHWGKPPQIQTKDIVKLPGKYGKGSSTLRTWILDKQAADKAKKGKKKSKNFSYQFPKHWGKPPGKQMLDFVELPGDYGHGSTTLRDWILAKQAEDKKLAKKKPAPKTTDPKAKALRLTAKDFPLDGGFYLDKGKWLAIDPEARKTAKSSFAFSYPSGNYHIVLLGVGENDGQAEHQLFRNDEEVLKFTVPLSKEAFETGKKFNKRVRKIALNSGDTLTLKSKVASADGKEFSRARLAGIRFIPADAKTTQAVSKKRESAPKDHQSKKKQLPALQQPRQENGHGAIATTGKAVQWQPVTLTLDGPFAHELDRSPNPFLDYALNVTFRHESGTPIYHVPGYFAADGKAGETSADSGTQWRAHFSPDKPGRWFYTTTFHTGENVALQQPNLKLDGVFERHDQFSQSGEIRVAPAPKNAPGFYSHGRLTYVNQPYLKFAHSGQYFMKAGADAPETLLAFKDFDNTQALKKKVPLKEYQPHLKDWQTGDPTWKNGKGKGLIGALNYLSGKGMNAFSFLTYNAGGDGDNVWPFVSRNAQRHYDCSKLDQWNIVFAHGQAKGLFLHFKLQETEIDDNMVGYRNPKKKDFVETSLNQGELGIERKLYLREIVARFGHHLALNWNLGEENTQTTKQQTEMASYLRAFDPYDHHLVIHTYPSQQDKVYKPLLGNPDFTGASLQNSNLRDVHWQTLKWRREAEKAGHAWAVAFDEPGEAQNGMPPDPDYPGMPENYSGPTIHDTRKFALWGNIMAGGTGVEYYFGYKLPQNDLIAEDWRSRDQSWDYAKVALDFFRDLKIPFWEMKPNPELVGNEGKENDVYCLTGKKLHLLYFPQGGVAPLKLKGKPTIQWFNPRTGKINNAGPWRTQPRIVAPDGNDWLAIIRQK